MLKNALLLHESNVDRGKKRFRKPTVYTKGWKCRHQLPKNDVSNTRHVSNLLVGCWRDSYYSDQSSASRHQNKPLSKVNNLVWYHASDSPVIRPHIWDSLANWGHFWMQWLFWVGKLWFVQGQSQWSDNFPFWIFGRFSGRTSVILSQGYLTCLGVDPCWRCNASWVLGLDQTKIHLYPGLRNFRRWAIEAGARCVESSVRIVLPMSWPIWKATSWLRQLRLVQPRPTKNFM